MNRADLVEHVQVAAEVELSKAQAGQIVESLLGGIQAALKKGEVVTLHGFGLFKVKDMPAREARNPATGEKIQVSAKKKVTFKAAKGLI